eukprot:scaffold2149_cov172-Amphora_coffeaeformis.AAC.4
MAMDVFDLQKLGLVCILPTDFGIGRYGGALQSCKVKQTSAVKSMGREKGSHFGICAFKPQKLRMMYFYQTSSSHRKEPVKSCVKRNHS